MGQLILSVDVIYNNLLLIAISRKYSFAKLVKEVEEEIKAHIEERKMFLPKCYADRYLVTN
ncbi:MAG: hypothetical protein K5662_09075 [Lachnospiraceae bacterium]|nr:hypothetical protein [Lachnospiraceae bacterium]